MESPVMIDSWFRYEFKWKWFILVEILFYGKEVIFSEASITGYGRIVWITSAMPGFLSRDNENFIGIL